MSFKKMTLSIEKVQNFSEKQLHTQITDITSLQGGEWSQAFGFKQDGRDLVVGFGSIEKITSSISY